MWGGVGGRFVVKWYIVGGGLGCHFQLVVTFFSSSVFSTWLGYQCWSTANWGAQCQCFVLVDDVGTQIIIRLCLFNHNYKNCFQNKLTNKYTKIRNFQLEYGS